MRNGSLLYGSPAGQDSLFDAPAASSTVGPWVLATVAQELGAQKRAIASSTYPARLTLLLSAESAGALVAAEMQYEGIPWREDLHRRLLNDLLGPEPTATCAHPEKLEALAVQLRTALNAPSLNPDSPQDLMRALHRAGIEAKSTRSWELQEFNHPAIEPLLTYRKLSRLFTTNGWNWLQQWVTDGRFHCRIRGGWRGFGALGFTWRRRHADPGTNSRRGRGRSWICADRCRRCPAGAARTGRLGPGHRHGCRRRGCRGEQQGPVRRDRRRRFRWRSQHGQGGHVGRHLRGYNGRFRPLGPAAGPHVPARLGLCGASRPRR